MSNILSDPMFIRAEVDYRLERFGPRPAGGGSWPDPSLRLSRWVAGLRRARRQRAPRPALGAVASAPPVSSAMIGAVAPRTAEEIVGRDDELARVLDGLQLGSGGGGAVLVGGDAGIGKTALVGQVVRAAVGHRVLVGHCVGEAGPASPTCRSSRWPPPWTPRTPSSSRPSSAARPALASLVPRLAAGAAGDALRGDVVEGVHGALTDLGRRGPVLLVVEDLHWADESSRELLTVLFTRGAPDGVSLVATYRSDDVHRRHPLAASLALWSRLPGLTRVDLGPLPAGDVREIVHRVDGSLGPEVVEEVVRRAEGNAFLAEELAASGGSPARAEGGDVGRLLLGRVEHLDAEAQDVVRVAAVIGRRVPHALLERVAGVDPATLRRALRAAVDHHVLEPRGDGYEFRHALLAEAVIDDLLPTERLELHRACAEALREDPSLGTPADLARHALTSGDRAAALEASLRAGDEARRMGGPAEALAHYETALTLLDVDPGLGQPLTLWAAAAANAAGRATRAMALLRRRLAEGADGPYERAELLGALAYAAAAHRGAARPGAAHRGGAGAARRRRAGAAAGVPARPPRRGAHGREADGRGGGARGRRDGARRRARPHRRPCRPRVDPRLARRPHRRRRRLHPPSRGPGVGMDRGPGLRAAPGDVHPRGHPLPPVRPARGALGVRAHGGGGAPGRARVVGLRRRLARDGDDGRLRARGVGPRRRARRDRPAPGTCPRAGRRASRRRWRTSGGPRRPSTSTAPSPRPGRTGARTPGSRSRSGSPASTCSGARATSSACSRCTTRSSAFLRDAWEQPRVMVEVRLAAVALGHLATAVRAGQPLRAVGAAGGGGPAARRGRGGVGAGVEAGTRRPGRAGCGSPGPSAEYRRVRWSAGEEVRGGGAGRRLA